MVVDLLLQPIRQGMTGRQFLASAAVSWLSRCGQTIYLHRCVPGFDALWRRSLYRRGPVKAMAAYNLEARMREGMSLKQAKESVVQDDYSDGSDACLSAIKHEINQMPYAFPLVHRALYKRMRR